MVLDVPAPQAFAVAAEASSVAQRWKQWIVAFDYYIAATGVTNAAQKKALLLHVAGREVQEIFATLEAANESLEAAQKVLTDYFTPKINIRYERFLFWQCSQEQGESIDSFVTRLHKLASTCEFPDANDVVIDQIIVKCNSSELRKKLLQEKNLTLSKAQEIARALEVANMQASSIEGKPNNSQQQVNKVAVAQPQKCKSFQQGKPTKPHQVQENKQKHHSERSSRCSRCGQEGHYPSDLKKCPASGQKCHQCGKIGHFSKMCKSMKRFTPKKIHSTQESDASVLPCTNKSQDRSQSESGEVEFAFRINSVGKERRKIMLKVNINKQPVVMQVDTAADVSIMSQDLAESLPNLVIEPTSKVLKDYSNNHIPVIGSAKVNVEYDSQIVEDLPLTIVKGPGQTLLGVDWLRKIKLDWSNIFQVDKQEYDQTSLTELLSQFEEVFKEGEGTVKNVKASLLLKPGSQPKFCPPRQIPFALKAGVEQEIRRLEETGKWVRVTYSDWGTPLVPIAKKDGGIRLCGDYKVTLNPQLQVAQHPLPNPAEMFSSLGDCKVFSKIDLKHAFQQLLMDEKAQEVCTLSTHLGLFRPQRLPFGVASSPALWQQTMDKIFTGLPGVFCFIDDILVAGKDVNEHLSRLKAVFQRFKDHGLKVREDKCQFHVPSVEYLGFVIDGQGIHKTRDKVKAIQDAKTPENVKELQSFLGLVTFYGRFLKDLATVAHPLHELLKKDVPWHWSADCQIAFEQIKTEILSPNFLVHFQSDLPVILVCDASSVGVGAVLAHTMPDGSERPIAFASRSLNKAERNYSQIEKEGLALVYGVKKFHMYLYGKQQFTLVTDHKPLLAILGPKAGLPTLVAARLQRWAVILSAYNYSMMYRNTDHMGNADALSRLPVDQPSEEPENTILLTETFHVPLKADNIAQSTVKDPVLSQVLQSLVTGRASMMLSEECKPYHRMWPELSVEQNCILRGARVVIPHTLRHKVLEELHAEHQGIVKSKAIARSFVWWPGMENDIENFVKKCEQCAVHQNEPSRSSLHPWEYPKYPWQRLHIDYAGPFLGHSYLIVVDAYSKWPEVIPTQSTTALSTIRALMSVFATHGLPERIVSDNGPQFTSQEFQEFLTVNGIYHTLSATYHPATNGEAERFVQTFKMNMKCRQATASNVISCIHKFLLAYRTTPQATTGVPPSQLLMGRRLRNKLDLMLPNFQSKMNIKEWKQLGNMKKVREFAESTPVMVRSYNSKEKWTPGKVASKLGNMHYEVEAKGSSIKRHVDQLLPSFSNKPDVSKEIVPNDCIADSAIPVQPRVHTSLHDPVSEPAPPIANTFTSPNTRELPPRAKKGVPPPRLDL